MREFGYNIKINRCTLRVWKYNIHDVYLLHVFSHSCGCLRWEGALQRTDTSKYYRSLSANCTGMKYYILKTIRVLKSILKIKIQIKIFVIGSNW